MHTNDSNTPLHLLKPVYDTPYGLPSIEQIKTQLEKILKFLEKATPVGLINRKNNLQIKRSAEIDDDTKCAEGDFRLTSYEWGVTYAGMLLVGDVTRDQRFIDYVSSRLAMISDLSSYYLANPNLDIDEQSPVYSVLHPKALDDAGALCTAMIKAEKAGIQIDLRPLINNFINYISEKQFRLPDGTFARNRPYRNTLWLDDLFMSVPALAQMGQLTKNNEYFDDAVKQIERFSNRMFDERKELFIHGWVEQMEMHPRFFWGRANAWAVMAMAELLSVLPETHVGYQAVLDLLRAHVKGLSRYQAGTGFWHQLLDRNDSYLETSATAIITYSIARAINNGLIDKHAFAPMAVSGWNAVSTKINNEGKVEGTCVGTGMGFDPTFYYYRPVNVFAAHGYGTVLLAGAEIIRLIESNMFVMNENSLQIKE